MSLLLDITVILALVFASGIYAAIEIAIVYLRRSRVRELMEAKVSAARDVDELQKNPGRFFAIVQIGMTVTGTLASAIGGAFAVQILEPMVHKIPIIWVSRASSQISITLVVIFVSYLFLVLGELVPKSLALRYPERISMLLAKPVHISGHLLSPVVWLLAHSQSLILRLVPGYESGRNEHSITESELKILIDDGRRSGAITATEHMLMNKILDFGDRQVGDIMTPREKIIAMPENSSINSLKTCIMEYSHTRLPIYKDTIDNVVGIVHARDIFYTEFSPGMVSFSDIVRKPYCTSREKMISSLMKDMQKNRIQMAIVQDNNGRTAGIITLEDILEEIVGEIEDEQRLRTRIRPL